MPRAYPRWVSKYARAKNGSIEFFRPNVPGKITKLSQISFEDDFIGLGDPTVIGGKWSLSQTATSVAAVTGVEHGTYAPLSGGLVFNPDVSEFQLITFGNNQPFNPYKGLSFNTRVKIAEDLTSTDYASFGLIGTLSSTGSILDDSTTAYRFLFSINGTGNVTVEVKDDATGTKLDSVDTGVDHDSEWNVYEIMFVEGDSHAYFKINDVVVASVSIIGYSASKFQYVQPAMQLIKGDTGTGVMVCDYINIYQDKRS